MFSGHRSREQEQFVVELPRRGRILIGTDGSSVERAMRYYVQIGRDHIPDRRTPELEADDSAYFGRRGQVASMYAEPSRGGRRGELGAAEQQAALLSSYEAYQMPCYWSDGWPVEPSVCSSQTVPVPARSAPEPVEEPRGFLYSAFRTPFSRGVKALARKLAEFAGAEPEAPEQRRKRLRMYAGLGLPIPLSERVKSLARSFSEYAGVETEPEERPRKKGRVFLDAQHGRVGGLRRHLTFTSADLPVGAEPGELPVLETFVDVGGLRGGPRPGAAPGTGLPLFCAYKHQNEVYRRPSRRPVRVQASREELEALHSSIQRSYVDQRRADSKRKLVDFASDCATRGDEEAADLPEELVEEMRELPGEEASETDPEDGGEAPPRKRSRQAEGQEAPSDDRSPAEKRREAEYPVMFCLQSLPSGESGQRALLLSRDQFPGDRESFRLEEVPAQEAGPFDAGFTSRDLPLGSRGGLAANPRVEPAFGYSGFYTRDGVVLTEGPDDPSNCPEVLPQDFRCGGRPVFDRSAEGRRRQEGTSRASPASGGPSASGPGRTQPEGEIWAEGEPSEEEERRPERRLE